MNARRTGAFALLAAVALLATACGPKAGPDASPDAGGVGQLETATPTTNRPPAPTNVAPTYPDDARAYAEEALEAWAHDDASWLEALTSATTYDKVIDQLGSVNDEWDFHRCDGTAGSSYCSFINSHGDVFTLRIRHDLLGKAHAATDAQLDETSYPNDGVAYVKEFVAAWQFGNEVRMLLLSTTDVVDDVPTAGPTNPSYPAPTCCGGGLLQVKVHWGGVFATFDVGTTLLGKPHAILGYDSEFGVSG